MKIRIVSDLHTDINNTVDFGFIDKLNETDLILIAGDIAGSYQNEMYFFKHLYDKNLNVPTISVAGNHLGYDYLQRSNRFVDSLDGTKEFSINLLHNLANPVHYLHNQDILVNSKIIFGGTMYTDFDLYHDVDTCKVCGHRYLNDFRYVYTKDKNVVRPITPDDYIKGFNTFMKSLRKRIKQTNEDGLDIIIVTHFAPSIHSIASRYLQRRSKYLNASYASNLEDFIKSNPRIKLWVHGHVHDCFDYNIGQCRVVCEPYGYFGYEQSLYPERYFGKVIEID